MREILFKGKRKDNRGWVYGDLITVSGRAWISSEKYDTLRLRSISNREAIWRSIEVIPDTVCQFTGLIDKYENKIWENDICDRRERYPEIVKMQDGDWTLDYSYSCGKDYGYNYCNLGFYAKERNCVKVIGNIFDNPELLEKSSR